MNFTQNISNIQYSNLYYKRIELFSGNAYMTTVSHCKYNLGISAKTYVNFVTNKIVTTDYGCGKCSSSYFLDIDRKCKYWSSTSSINCANSSVEENLSNNIYICEEAYTDNNTNQIVNNTTTTTNTTNKTQNTTINITANTTQNKITNTKNNITSNNITNLTICPINTAFYQGICQSCSLIPHVYPNCSDICGNGYFYNYTSNIQCNDGNVISNDGCSSQCIIEPNYVCPRYNYSSYKKCVIFTPLSIALTPTNDQTMVFLQFNRAISQYIDDNQQILINFTNIINISINSLNRDKYSYDISLYDSATLIVKFYFLTSFSNVNYQIYTTQSNALLLKDDNNISIYSSQQNPIKNSSLYISLANGTIDIYIHNSDQNKEQLNEIYLNSKITTYSALLFSSLPFFWIGFLQFLWFMLDSMQITNYFLYINILLPENAQKLLGMFAEANLYFLTNLFNSVFGLDFQTNYLNKEINPLVRAPDKFQELGITSLYLNNAGAFVLTIAILYLLYGLLNMLNYIQTKKYHNKYMNDFILKAQLYYKHPLIIRIQSIFFLNICLATCLQIRCFTTLDSNYFYNYIFAFMSFIYIMWFFILIFRISNNENTVFENSKYLDYYSKIFNEANLNLFLGRNYFMMTNLRKLVLAMIVVFLYDYPYFELALLIIGESISVVVVFQTKIFRDKYINYFIRFAEISIILALFMLLAIKIYSDENFEGTGEIDNASVEAFFTLGWIFTGFIFGLIGVFVLIMNWSIFLSIKKGCEWIKHYFQEKNKRVGNKFESIVVQSPHDLSEDVSSDKEPGISKIM